FWKPGQKNGARRREVYEDRDARISILAGLGPRPDTLMQTDHGVLEETTCNGAGHTFFERRDGVWILLVGLRAGAHVREAQVLQGAIDRVVRHRQRKLLIETHHHPHARQRTTPWTAGIGPSFTIRARKALCVSSSLG